MIDDGNVNISQLEPIPLKLTDEDIAAIRGSAEFTPVFAAWQTYVFQGLPAETQAQQILPADLKRRKAYLQVRGTNGTVATAEGSVTSPGANVALATIAVAGMTPGWYTVNWTAELDGTVSATDENNFIVKGPGLGAGIQGTNDAVVGRYQQNSFSMYVPSGNGTALSVRTVGVGTVGAIYSGQITITPLTIPGGFILVGQYGQVQNGQGGKIFANDPRWEIRSHSALWMAGDGVTTLNVTLYIERDQGT